MLHPLDDFPDWILSLHPVLERTGWTTKPNRNGFIQRKPRSVAAFVASGLSFSLCNSQRASSLSFGRLLIRVPLPPRARPDYVSGVINYAVIIRDGAPAKDRHRRAPRWVEPGRSSAVMHTDQRDSPPLSPTTKECDCRLAQRQNVRKQEAIINPRLPSSSGHQTEFLSHIFLSVYALSHALLMIFFFYSLLQLHVWRV